MTEEAPSLDESHKEAEVTEPVMHVSPQSIKQYFDEKLHPQLSAALTACARQRPEDPVSFVGNFLLDSAKSRE